MLSHKNERNPNGTNASNDEVTGFGAAELNNLSQPSTARELAHSLSPKEGLDPDALIETESETLTSDIGLFDSERLARGLAAVDEQLCAEVDAEVARMRAAGERTDPSQFRDDGPDPFGIDFVWAGGK